jgi:hypothetical protein
MNAGALRKLADQTKVPQPGDGIGESAGSSPRALKP